MAGSLQTNLVEVVERWAQENTERFAADGVSVKPPHRNAYDGGHSINLVLQREKIEMHIYSWSKGDFEVHLGDADSVFVTYREVTVGEDALPLLEEVYGAAFFGSDTPALEWFDAMPPT